MNRFRFDRLCVGVLNCPMRNVFFSFLITLGAAVLTSCESPSKTKNGRAQNSSNSQSLIVECHKALEPIVLAIRVFGGSGAICYIFLIIPSHR